MLVFLFIVVSYYYSSTREAINEMENDKRKRKDALNSLGNLKGRNLKEITDIYGDEYSTVIENDKRILTWVDPEGFNLVPVFNDDDICESIIHQTK